MTRSVADINAEIRDVVDRLGALRADRGGHGADQGGLEHAARRCAQRSTAAECTA
jgi:hypothetical protein